MRRVSKKRAAMLRIYAKRRDAYLTAHPYCAIGGEVATEVHHMAGRIGAALLDESRWLPVCADCHRHITDHPADALANGWSLPRVGGAA